MKRIISLAVITALGLSIGGCSSKSTNSKSSYKTTKAKSHVKKKKNNNVFKLKMSMSDKNLAEAISLRMYGVDSGNYFSGYKNDLFFIKNGIKDKDVRRYWAYLNLAMYSTALGEMGRKYVIGMPKHSTTKRTLIKAENIVRLKYDVPTGKLPQPNDMHVVKFTQPWTESVEKYINTGSL